MYFLCTLLLCTRPEVLREMKNIDIQYILFQTVHMLCKTHKLLTGICNMILTVLLRENNFLKEESCVVSLPSHLPPPVEINRAFKEKYLLFISF